MMDREARQELERRRTLSKQPEIVPVDDLPEPVNVVPAEVLHRSNEGNANSKDKGKAGIKSTVKHKDKLKPVRKELPGHLKRYQTRLQRRLTDGSPKPFPITLTYQPYPWPYPSSFPPSLSQTASQRPSMARPLRTRAGRAGQPAQTENQQPVMAPPPLPTIDAIHFPKPGISIAFSDGEYEASSFSCIHATRPPSPSVGPVRKRRKRGSAPSPQTCPIINPTHVVRLTPFSPLSKKPREDYRRKIPDPRVRLPLFNWSSWTDYDNERDVAMFSAMLGPLHPTNAGPRFTQVAAGGAQNELEEAPAYIRLQDPQLQHVRDFLGLALPDEPEPRRQWYEYPNNQVSDPVHVLVTAPAPSNASRAVPRRPPQISQRSDTNTNRMPGAGNRILSQSAKDIAAILAQRGYLIPEDFREALFQLEDMAASSSSSGADKSVSASSSADRRGEKYARV